MTSRGGRDGRVARDQVAASHCGVREGRRRPAPKRSRQPYQCQNAERTDCDYPEAGRIEDRFAQGGDCQGRPHRRAVPTTVVEVSMEYTVILHNAEEGGYWVEVPALPGCFSQGETVDEALESVQDAIR